MQLVTLKQVAIAVRNLSIVVSNNCFFFLSATEIFVSLSWKKSFSLQEFSVPNFGMYVANFGMKDIA